MHTWSTERMPTGLSTMHLYPIDGAAHRVEAQATALAYRRSRYGQVIVGVDPDPANAEAISAWARRTGTRCTRTRPAAPT